MKRIVLVSLLAVVLVACQDGTSPRDSDFEGANFDIFDGLSTGGNVDFFFLPPLTSSPRGGSVGDRPANPNLSPFARVCKLNFGDEFGTPPLKCVGGGGNIGDVANLAMTFSETGGFYNVNWQTGDPDQTGGAPLDTDTHYRIEIFVGSGATAISLGFRDVDPDPGPPKGRCRREAFCQFNNGSNLAIKTIIESGAFCLELGGDPDNCATATVPPGGTLELQGVAIAQPEQGGTLNIQTCFDLRNSVERPLAGDGRVDLRTFGPCIEIIALDLGLSGLATLCDPFTTAELDVLSPEQIKRMAVHRHSANTAFAVALAHSDGPACATSAPEQALELNSLERFVRFARNAWRAVSNRVVAWIEPAPLFARTMFRCNRGGCSGIGDFRSSYQVALPAWMDAPDGTDLGSHTLGTVLTVRVRTQDSGELEDVDGVPVPAQLELANDVRLTFVVNGGSPIEVRTGPVGGFADGIAELQFNVAAGANTVVVSGIGVGTAVVGGTFLNVFGPSINAAGDGSVTLAVGTLTFTATGIVPLGFVPDPPTGTINIGNIDLEVATFTFDVCAVDENGDPVEGVVVEITSLVAIKNNGDPVILGNVTLPGFTNPDTGCLLFEDVTINKTGAYRLVVNGEFVSLKFNVKPAKKK